LVDFFLHLDKHLAQFVASYGTWVYGLLFAIIFAETGLVVTPFLPGDSLLFAAAILGNIVNYSIGRFVGPRVFRAARTATGFDRFLNREYLDRAHAFF